MPIELFQENRAATTVSSGGTDAPSSGTVETWTVASSAMFGAAVTAVSQFHVADPAAPSEIILVTNISGTTWTVTRGAESTTPVAHAAGFTIYQVTTAGFLGLPPQWFNVRSSAYGATGNGTTDDTTAIQAAITAAHNAGGGVVYLPAGTYKLSSALTIGTGVTLAGDGLQVTTLTQTSTSANGISVTSASAISDVTLQGFTLTGPGSGSGVGIFASANSGSALVTRLAMRNLLVQSCGSHGIEAQNCILSEMRQVESLNNGARGCYLANGTTWMITDSWFNYNPNERGFYGTGLTASTLASCGSDSNAIGYELYQCNQVALMSCDTHNTAAGTSGLDGSGVKVNNCYGVGLYGISVNQNAAIGYYFLNSSYGCVVLGCSESASAGATAGIETASGTGVLVSGDNFATAASYAGGSALDLAPSYTYFPDIEAGSFQSDGVTVMNGGSKTSGSAPVLTSLGAVSGTAIQLSDATRDYTVYLEVTTSGTATAISIGHTSAASDVTILSSVAVTAGNLYSFRLPAAWYFKWTGTTTAIGNQNAVGC